MSDRNEMPDVLRPVTPSTPHDAADELTRHDEALGLYDEPPAVDLLAALQASVNSAKKSQGQTPEGETR